MRLSPILVASLVAAVPAAVLADWPQWRGPDRNGIAAEDAKLPDVIPEDYQAELLWESIEIPSDHYGGHGSVAVEGDRVYLSVVWHRDEPTTMRRIDSDVMSSLGFRGTGSIPEEIREKMEHERMNLSRRLRGAALDEWANQWVEEHLDERTQLSLGSWIVARFRQGQSAIPLSVYDVLLTARDETFANQAEMEAWVDAQGFEPEMRDRIVAAVPSTRKVADDVVLCLDLESGEEVWRYTSPGYPSGRSSSSTPAVVDGKIYATLSEYIYALDAASGDELWRAPLSGRRGPASSPLVADGRLIVQQDRLTAFDAATGEELWESTEVRGSNPSPAYWKGEDGAVVICNSSNQLVGIDAATGATLWTAPGGGDGSPVVYGDKVVISSRNQEKNLIAYRLGGDEGPEEAWSHQFLARRYSSSPLVYEGHVYYMGSERHLCLDLESGEVRWEREAQSSISSPIIADGKILVYENRGGYAHIIKAVPDDYQSVGRVRVGALYCASPSIVGRDLVLRTARNVLAYRIE